MKKIILMLIYVFLVSACHNLSEEKASVINQNISAKKQMELNEQLFDAIDKADWAGMKAALVAGANINALSVSLCEGGACGEGQTPLMMVSSYHNSADIVKFLLDKGADVNAKGQYGMTALMKAAEGGRIENVKLLLKAGADINAKNEADETALFCAVTNGYTEVVELLKAAGAKE